MFECLAGGYVLGSMRATRMAGVNKSKVKGTEHATLYNTLTCVGNMGERAWGGAWPWGQQRPEKTHDFWQS